MMMSQFGEVRCLMTGRSSVKKSYPPLAFGTPTEMSAIPSQFSQGMGIVKMVMA